MPRNQPVDAALVLATYAETGSNRETARRLGLHENTVLKVRRTRDGACRRCGQPSPTGEHHCATCRDWMATHQRTRRVARKNAGLCIQCENPIAPGSVSYCAQHRADFTRRSREQNHADRLRMGEDAYRARQSHRNRLYSYGPHAVTTWNASGKQCAVCGAPYRKRHLHIHHIDEDRSNGAPENLICLCSHCHRLVHAFLWHPNLAPILEWVKATYPQFA